MGSSSMPRDAKGRFTRKITILPDVLGPQRGSKNAGGYVIVNTDFRKAVSDLEGFNQRVSASILADPDKRAALIQARLRTATALAYNKAATGRMARGIFAKVNKVGSADGRGVETAIVVTMFNYRETNYLTNLGGDGYFKVFPVGPYRIFAQGAEGLDDLRNPATGRRSKTSARKAIGLALGVEGVGRLKVPRSTAFFTAGREQGRGGGERRTINDVLGPAASGDLQSAFFFYPLWINHPGFTQDVISDVALDEGARFKSEVVDAIAFRAGQLRKLGTVEVPVSSTLPDTTTVVSHIIPLPGSTVVERANNRIAFSRGRIIATK